MNVIISICSYSYTYSPKLMWLVSDGVNSLYIYAVWCSTV